MMVIPKVSIICWTYNQEEYIGQTIESFLMQQTNFPFEIIVHDDASTDNTADIIRSYEKKYPGIIRPIYQKVNQFSSGTSAFINHTLQVSRGSYIALCEGDDYWTDPLKLQLQADLLDSHPNYSLCFHRVKVVFQNGEEDDMIFPSDAGGFTVRKLLDHNFIQTNSVMYRRQDYERLPIDIMPRDWYLHLYHAQFGKIGFINRAMSVYRRHSGGIWWDSYKDVSSIWKKYGDKYIKFLHYTMLMYGKNGAYKEIILNKHIAGIYEAMALIEPRDIDHIAQKAIGGAPEDAWDYIKLLLQRENDIKEQKLESEQRLSIEIQKREKEVHELINAINEIKSSKAWRLVMLYRKTHGRIKRN